MAFLAALEVERDAVHYFGSLERSDAVREDIVLNVPRFVPVRSLARAAGVSLKDLRAHNPALLQPVWDGTKYVPRDATLRIPAQLTDKDAAAIVAAIPVSQRFFAPDAGSVPQGAAG